ncbi:MAG TPA: N-acetyltransferase [Planctomycetes bacterium]|nr:N-acetyltransferase [Planctomycetota bacterium]
MPGPSLRITEVASRRDLRRFIDLPYALYAGHPLWVPPLRGEVRRQLTTHPFHRHAETRCFLAERNGRAVGRVAAIIDRRYNEFHETCAGAFGYFECAEDPDAARALLAAACEALRAGGATTVFGPASPSSNGEFGLLIEGFERMPAVMMPYHREHYRGFVEDFGFAKGKDLLAYEITQERLDARTLDLFERLRARASDITVRPVDTRRFAGEVARMRAVYNAAWERNWGFVPMTDEEFDDEAAAMKRITDPRVMFIAEHAGAPVGIALSVPDVNPALKAAGGRLFPFGALRFARRARTITRLRTILLGVVRGYRDRGLDGILVGETIRRGLAAGYTATECSWILEDNRAMCRPLEKLGGVVTKVYRVYERAL